MATTRQTRNSGSTNRAVVEHSGLFSGGLNTELSDTIDAVPYTSDECNCVIRSNGTRSRRLGLDFERNFRLLNYATAEDGEDTDKWAFNMVEWVDVKDRPGEHYIVLQTGLKLFFFKNDGAPYSDPVEMTKDGKSVYYLDVSRYVLEKYRGLPPAEIKSIEDEKTLLYSIDVKGVFYNDEGVSLGSYKKADDNENNVYKGTIETENGNVIFKIEEGFLKDVNTSQNIGKVFAEYKVDENGIHNWTAKEECKRESLRFTEAYGSLFVCGKYIQPFAMRGLEPPESGVIEDESPLTAVLDIRAHWNNRVARQYDTERAFQLGSYTTYTTSAFICYEQYANNIFYSLNGHESGNRGDYLTDYKMIAGMIGVFDRNETLLGWIDYDHRKYEWYDPVGATTDGRRGSFKVMRGRPVDYTEEYIGSGKMECDYTKSDVETYIDSLEINGQKYEEYDLRVTKKDEILLRPIDDFGNIITPAGGSERAVPTANYYAKVWNALPDDIKQGVVCTAKTPFEGDRTEENERDNGTPEYLIFTSKDPSLSDTEIKMREVYKTNKYTKRWFGRDTKETTLLGYLRYTKTVGLSLKIRDFEGVLDIQDYTVAGSTLKDVDFRLGRYVAKCPQKGTEEHLYNLHNQGWDSDQITAFKNDTEIAKNLGYVDSENNVLEAYPANNMQWFVAKKDFGDTDASVREFKPAELLNTAFGGTIAPRGHYILDYFDQDRERVSGFKVSEASLAETSKPRFPYVTDIAAYAGRIFYLVGDTVLYSQVIAEDFSRADKCYQEADPTSETLSDLVDTDGGMIVLSEIGTGLRFCIAGGVLGVVGNRATALIGGGSENVFTATAYTAATLMTIGSVSPDSFVLTEEGLFYWAITGIARLKTTGGNVVYEIISQNSIQTLYDNIPEACAKNCKAVYDKPAKTIVWMYPDEEDTTKLVNFLLLNIQTGRWTRYRIANERIISSRQGDEQGDKDTPSPYVCAAISLEESYKIENEYYLYAEKDGIKAPVVTDEGDYVLVEEPLQTDRILYSSILYLINDQIQSSVTFGNFNNNNFKDWAKADQDGSGFDYESYLITHPILLNNQYQNKTVPYLLATFRRTEQGFDLFGNGIHPSACQGSVMWDWPENGNSGKWDAQQELYRYDKGSILDGKMVSSKTRIYGSGRALQIRLSSVANKGFIVENAGLQVYVDGRI